jgi:hypothetical protein
MWNGIGVIAGLIAIVIVVWQAVRLANINIEVGVTPSMITAALAVLLVIFTFIKFLADNEFRTFWAWLGLLLSIVIVVFAVQIMAAGGESLGDMKKSMTAAASSAATAAKGAADSATDRGSDTAAAGSDAPADSGSSGDEPEKPA